MTADEFDAATQGFTITYDYGGGIIGIEEYMADRTVRFAFEGDKCIYGIWYQKDDQICFDYDNSLEPVCWHYFLENGRIRGTYLGLGGGWDILESARDTGPLPCSGPDVGV